MLLVSGGRKAEALDMNVSMKVSDGKARLAAVMDGCMLRNPIRLFLYTCMLF